MPPSRAGCPSAAATSTAPAWPTSSPGPGAGPHVKIFDGATLNELASFFASDPTSLSGVLVGVGNFVAGSSSRLEVVGSVNGSIRVFGFTPSGNSLLPYVEQDPLVPFGPGIDAAPAFIQLDSGVSAFLVGAVSRGSPHVKIISATSNTVVNSFLAFDNFLGGVVVG